MCYCCLQEEGTVKPAEPFDPKKDCEVLRKAMKGLGTDEDAIIGVWPKRTNAQRQELKKMYRSMYNKVRVYSHVPLRLVHTFVERIHHRYSSSQFLIFYQW